MAMLRVGVWFDGSYFSKVSDYFCYEEQVGRLKIDRVLDLAKKQIANLASVGESGVSLTKRRWIRGKFSATESESAGKLGSMAAFDDVLQGLRIKTSFYPMLNGVEKQVDVAIATDILQATFNDEVDAVVLFSGDSDFIPALEAIKSYSKYVVVMGADERETNLSPKIARELYKVADTVIDLRQKSREEPNLFFQPTPPTKILPLPRSQVGAAAQERREATITGIYKEKGGFGFLEDKNINCSAYFHSSANPHFAKMYKGARVTYGCLTHTARGFIAGDVQIIN